MDAKIIADKYISRDGKPPKKSRPPRLKKPASGEKVTITREDYERLVMAAEADQDIGWCEKCGAWVDKSDPVWHEGELRSCIWYASGYDERYKGWCRSERALTK